MSINLGIWESHTEIDPPEQYGFIYRITNTITDEFYIGQKRFWRKATKKPLKGRVNRRHTQVESDWRGYTSSSTTLNAQIKEMGSPVFRFEILETVDSANLLNLREIQYILEYGFEKLNLNQFVARGASIKQAYKK